MALSRDARLVARVKRGDSSAFEELHARHQPAILAFCRHLTGNREDAEDAVQHTFLAVYRRIVESDDVLELRPWLFAVARNRSLSLLRARRDRVVTNPDAATAFDGLAVEVERRQELRDLVCDMSRLPEPQRAALVLSQLDALSYREIGSVLEVPAEKVKALVFQARSSLASTREAREAPCFEIRSEIATARGSGLRRRLLRRHVGQCDGCREFEVSVLRQRRDLAILLPVAPSAGLGQAILEGALGREGATTTAGAGGAVAATGGVGGAGLAGTLASLAGGGAAKLAVVAVVAGGSAAGAVAADLPERIQSSAPVGASDRVEAGSHASAPQADEGGGTGAGAPRPLPDDGEPGREGPSADGEKGAGHSDATEAPTRDGEIGGENAAGNGVDDGAEDDGPEDDGAEDAPAVAEDNPADLPPGLAKRDELPPGLAKRDELPPGLAKGRGGDAPGNGNGGQGDGVAPGLDGGEQDNVGGGNGNGNANVDTGAGQGNGNAGGQGNNGGGQGGGNAGGQGNGNGNAGQGNSGGQANGNGNGNGNPH